MKFQVHKRKPGFTQVDNGILRNNELSMRAKGLLSHLLSFPEKVVPTTELLLQQMHEGRTALRSGMKELTAAGHARLVKHRNPLGQIRSHYEIFETPIALPAPSTGFNNAASGDIARQRRLDVDTSQELDIATAQDWWGRSLKDWIERLREKGLKPRNSGSGWIALCPCHNDRKPSLSIRSGEKRAVVAKCHAGCSFEDIAEFLFGGALMESRVYTYTDANDKPLFRVIRNPMQKSFTVQSFINGQWVNRKPRSIPNVPYRLFQLQQAVREQREVWIAEGEKDVESFRQKGFVATCNAFGAGKWSCALNKFFARANVIIVADKDEIGMTHALNVYLQLRPIVSTVRIVRAAGDETVKDATDHFARGFTVNDFVEVDVAAELDAREKDR